jgi:hypothetical protein
VIWVEGKPNYFCEEDWTGQISLKRLRKLARGGYAVCPLGKQRAVEWVERSDTHRIVSDVSTRQ